MSDSYRAMAYATEIPGGSAPGQISFEDNHLHFRSDQITRSVFSLGDLQMRLDGAGGKEAFMNHPALPGWELLVLDARALQDTQLAEIPHLHALLGEATKKQRKMPGGLKFLLWLPVTLTLVLGACMLAIKPLARAATNNIPISAEITLGETIWKSSNFGSRNPEVKPELQEKLNKATARLLPQVQSTGYPFEFTIIDDSTPNAFALPGGRIAVHRGLLELATRPEQVAGVIAHEMAHVTQRHSLRQIVQSAGLQVVFSVLLGDTSLGGLSEAAAQLKTQAFSRDIEREADAAGWKYLVDAKIDPKGLLEFFELLKKETESKSGLDLPTILSTHPATQERIDNLTGWLNELPKDFQAKPL